MTLLRASITNISPSRLFILRWACKLIGANMKAWKTRSRKEAETMQKIATQLGNTPEVARGYARPRTEEMKEGG